ncbi:hypothetical protein EXIGLDRAFT_721172 [Exidia glandulosa HHB12029]|uniref:Uncharacterized protein n=1 Tax=Exidia glandulosa HHB12029 TaxID=1314781 RepID=A0A165FVP0_EXIGL|nr:hypothetical protein EXIGLDRAFT_721172 [Exidia glandulosa HHB12029]
MLFVQVVVVALISACVAAPAPAPFTREDLPAAAALCPDLAFKRDGSCVAKAPGAEA